MGGIRLVCRRLRAAWTFTEARDLAKSARRQQPIGRQGKLRASAFLAIRLWQANTPTIEELDNTSDNSIAVVVRLLICPSLLRSLHRSLHTLVPSDKQYTLYQDLYQPTALISPHDRDITTEDVVLRQHHLQPAGQ